MLGKGAFKASLCRLSLVLALAGTSAAPALAADVTWDMANEYPPTNIHSEADRYFAARLAEHSGGSIEIVHHFGASLGYRSKDQFDAVADGAVPIADTYVGTLSGIDPLFLLSSIPFLTVTAEDAKALFEVARADYEKLFEENNQILLFVSPWPPSGLWGKQPLDSKGALAGLKMRTYDANGTVTFKAVGAAPVQLSFADVIPQLSTGGIDAVLNSAEGGIGGKYWEYLSDFTEINYSMPLNMVHLNRDAFHDLTETQQQAVLKAAADTQEHIWQNVVERRAGNYATLKENGITITKADGEAFRTLLIEATSTAENKWLKDMGERGQAILNAYRNGR